ncbi:hypothetical protein LQZ21_07960 [Treponema sp. TIM-1]|uniref:hypothetical protein n=1 Tax=Treponema sp. TIM-1 TaxID=2898417 RepID=UPI0039810F12
MGKKHDPSWTGKPSDYIITEPHIGNRSDVLDLLDRLIERANASAGAWNVSREISAWAGSLSAALAALRDAVNRNSF